MKKDTITISVKFLQHEGDAIVSRSQAKKLIAELEQFQEVILDFHDVQFIGQPFADEVFRVFQNSHPDTNLHSINTNEDIEKMIRHVTTKRN